MNKELIEVGAIGIAAAVVIYFAARSQSMAVAANSDLDYLNNNVPKGRVDADNPPTFTAVAGDGSVQGTFYPTDDALAGSFAQDPSYIPSYMQTFKLADPGAFFLNLLQRVADSIPETAPSDFAGDFGEPVGNGAS
jgi:hypothetical protein